MATEVKRRRGSTSDHEDFIGAVGELTVDLDKDTVVVHNGQDEGGFPLLREDFSNAIFTVPDARYLLESNNLSDLDNVSTARDNLELGASDDVTFNTVTADLIGDVTGNVTGDVTGDLTGAIHVQGKNDTGGTLTKGTPVYISGQVAQGQQFTIGVADSDGSGTMPSIGVLSADVNDNAMGDIVTHGKLIGIDTSSFTVGDELFIGSNGTLVNTPPTGESNLLQKIAKVIRVDGSSGQIYIMGAGRTNAVPNLDEGKIFAGDANNQAVTTDVIDVNIASGLVTINDDLTVNGIVITDEIDTTSITWNTSTLEWDADPSEKFNNPVFIGTSLDVDNGINADQHVHAGTYLKADTYLEVGTSATIGTTLDVTGATTLSTLNVTGNTIISGTLDAPTLNTGQGDNELYAMNQDVQTTDGVIFDTLSVTNNASVGGSLTLSGEADFNSTMNLQGDLTTQANLADDGYATGWSGTNWQIQADGSAELQELRVRGALRVFEFIAKQISTIGGSEILSIAQGRVVSVDSDNDTITVENVTGTAGNSFKENDLFICQVTDINNDLESGGTGSIVKSVRGGVLGVVGNDIEVSITSGNLTDLVTGDLIVAYGNTLDADRQAIMYRNVDRSEDSLIMRMQTEVNGFSDLQNEANTRVAFGDLGPRPSNSTGYSGLTSETFGFFAGDNSGGHILATSSGLFLKDGGTTLAQLTSNTFKVGGDTKYIEFDGTDLDIQTDTFNLDTTNLDISSANENIVIGTGSALMTVGKLSSVEQGIKIDSNGITNQNYWKLGQGDVLFKVGDGTNFLSFNENAGTFEIKSEVFDLTSGNLRIKSTGTTYPSDSANTEVTTSDVSDFRLATLANGFNTNSLAINNNRWVKFQFDYSQSVPAGSFTAGITVTLEVSTNNSTFTDYGLFSDTRIDFNTNYFVADNATGNRLNVVDQSDSTKTEFKFTSSQTGSCTGTITMYFYVNEKDTTTHIRFNVLDSSGVTLSGASATDIGTRDYNPVTELNPSGVFTRLSDSLILSNGNTYIDYSLIT
jgi:hypothetical protein